MEPSRFRFAGLFLLCVSCVCCAMHTSPSSALLTGYESHTLLRSIGIRVPGEICEQVWPLFLSRAHILVSSQVTSPGCTGVWCAS